MQSSKKKRATRENGDGDHGGDNNDVGPFGIKRRMSLGNYSID